MPQPTTHDLGHEVRDRRVALGLSVRALAQTAGVSAGYVTAIEHGRSASTGRAPAVSLRVLDGLASALGCTIDELTGARSDEAAPHVLLYCIEATGPLFAAVDAAFGGEVDHWIYIADPRHPERAPDGRATICTWELGAFPYATSHLHPEDILTALEREVKRVAKHLAGRRVGLAIMDCSAVMRYVQNAADEVGFEHAWHDGVHRIWREHLGSEPAIDVCGYRHADVEALGLTIDQLGTALTLIGTHDRVVVTGAGDAPVSGRAAIRRILAEARPTGVSAQAWREMTRAAADSLALA
jgi:transcriptional regulator with XRE-family HTH domain